MSTFRLVSAPKCFPSTSSSAAHGSSRTTWSASRRCSFTTPALRETGSV